MHLKVRLNITVDEDASWIPSDRVHGVASELEELIIDAIENCIDGVQITVIGVKIDD